MQARWHKGAQAETHSEHTSLRQKHTQSTPLSDRNTLKAHLELLRGAVLLEGGVAAEEEIEDAAYRPHIARTPVAVAKEHLGGYEARGPVVCWFTQAARKHGSTKRCSRARIRMEAKREGLQLHADSDWGLWHGARSQTRKLS